jgi:outer membrane protein OmpA-like peptidoglycan-associated protein
MFLPHFTIMFRHPLLLILLFPTFTLAQKRDSINIYFNFNSAALTTTGMHSIDSAIKNHMFLKGMKLSIIGYTDYVGGNVYNDSLSQVRAQAAMDYLLTKGFQKQDIKLCIGKGKIAREPVNGNSGYAEDRKVSIIKETKAAHHYIDLQKMNVNETATIDGLNFYSGTTDFMNNTSFDALDDVCRQLASDKHMKVRIEGHVCCMTFGIKGGGTVIENKFDDKLRLDDMDLQKNMPLSQSRAIYIRQYMIDHGVPAERITTIGLGETETEAKAEKTQDDMMRNRRIDIRILEK